MKGQPKTRPHTKSQLPPKPQLKSRLKPSTKQLSSINAARFQVLLMDWYRQHARILPWRGVNDPYRTWVSEVMLQQTRVAAVIEHYEQFLKRFPTIVSLALADESAVLAAWSGLGYYRRARMLHKAAQFITEELSGVLPATSTELRTLPGIGVYTCAAIASIAFGESIAVVDGNVERVLLRITGRPEDATADGHAFVQKQAQMLVPIAGPVPPSRPESTAAARPKSPAQPETSTQPQPVSPLRSAPPPPANPPGDHNQAMMELGATICLPRSPLCLHCPVFSMCLTRGEHQTLPRAAQTSRKSAFLLSLRKRGIATEVLLERRPKSASLMPGMYELPPLPMDAVVDREPLLRVRHAITSTNYYVQVFAPRGRSDTGLRSAIPAASEDLVWVATRRLPELPLTGLARKILQRLDVMAVRKPELALM